MAMATAAKESVLQKGTRRRMRLFWIIVLCFTGWVVFTLWNQGVSLRQKQAELTELQGKFAEVQGTNEQYKDEVTRLRDSEYIEQKVRKDYGMVRPGDTIFDR
jgi:cell division protein DivIC